MADMLADGLEYLDEQLTAHSSTAWTYRRTSSSCTVYVTEERQRLRVSDRQVGTKVIRPDFAGTFSASELDFGAGAVEPRDGDTLERVFGSVTRKFRLTPMAPGEAAWHYTDPQQNRVRVMAKRITNA